MLLGIKEQAEHLAATGYKGVGDRSQSQNCAANLRRPHSAGIGTAHLTGRQGATGSGGEVSPGRGKRPVTTMGIGSVSRTTPGDLTNGVPCLV